MANAVYLPAKQKFLSAGLDLTTVTVKAVLIDSAAYTFSSAHEFLTSVAGGARIGTPQTLGTKTVTNGVFDAADITFTAVTGATCEAILIYVDTGVEATSSLIAYLDTATGLPVTPNGGDIVVAWDAGANKIFAL